MAGVRIIPLKAFGFFGKIFCLYYNGFIVIDSNAFSAMFVRVSLDAPPIRHFQVTFSCCNSAVVISTY